MCELDRRTGVVEEQRIIRLCIPYKPTHGSNDVGFCWLTHVVPHVVAQHDHIFPSISKVRVQIPSHVLSIVDTPLECSTLPGIVYADEKRLAFARAGRVLELIALGCSISKSLHR